MEKRARRLLYCLMVLMFAAAFAMVVEPLGRQNSQTENIRIFQRAVGGLGMGAIATPIWQFINYDVRILSVDDSMTWPVPGGYSYGPDRTGTVSWFQEIADDQWVIHRR